MAVHAAALQPTPTLSRCALWPEIPHHYEVLAVLRYGAAGRVCQVRNTVSGRVEAMKTLLPARAQVGEFTARFLREIRMHAGLDHPNIVRVHAAQWFREMPWMTMEYVPGGTLASILRRGPLPMEQAVSYAWQALSALASVHEAAIVHRDIKPLNLLVSPEGVVKLIDFGVALRRSENSGAAMGGMLGSPHYMAPEQIRDSACVDTRSDLYGLGVVLYEMLTGGLPFPGERAFAVLRAHLHAVPRDPVSLIPSLPRALNAVVLKTIEKDPDRRFGSAAEFRDALTKATARARRKSPLQWLQSHCRLTAKPNPITTLHM
jgi:serine/threonine protein kinase